MKLNDIVTLLCALVFVFLSIGWVRNLIWIVNHLSDDIDKMFIFRCIGVFFGPLGGFLGWFA